MREQNSLNSTVDRPFPGNQRRVSGFVSRRRVVSQTRRDLLSHFNGITVNKTTQTVESAAGTFHIEDVYPLVECGRFPVKRIVGERVEIWADIYRDGHDIIDAALIWRGELDREWRREPMVYHSNDGGAEWSVRRRPAGTCTRSRRGPMNL